MDGNRSRPWACLTLSGRFPRFLSGESLPALAGVQAPAKIPRRGNKLIRRPRGGGRYLCGFVNPIFNF